MSLDLCRGFKFMIIVNNVQQGQARLSTYLDVPPPIGCPWFGVEALVLITIMFIQMLCIPDEVGGD